MRLFFRLGTIGSALGVLLVLGARVPVQAQEPLDAEGLALRNEARLATRAGATAVRRQAEALRKSDPARAIALIDAFIAQKPPLTSDVGLLIRLRAETQLQGLKDVKAALATYQQARAWNAVAVPNLSPWARVNLLTGEAQALLADQNAERAVALLEAEWPLVATSNLDRENYVWRRTEEAAETYIKALDKAGQTAQVPDALVRRLLQTPTLLSFSGQDKDLGGWMLDALCKRLNQAQRPTEAAAWRKLSYQTCDYSAPALETATLQLARVWNDEETVRAFGRAQTASAAPNPLDALPQPAWQAQTRQVLEQRTREAQSEVARALDAPRAAELIGLYLVNQRFGAAMQLAWHLAQGTPDSPQAAAQVCRVFKAADLDMVRAEAYLGWTQGRGDNPVPDFLAQHHRDAAVFAAEVALPAAQAEAEAEDAAAPPIEWAQVRQAQRGVTLGLVSVGAVAPQEAWKAGALRMGETLRLLDKLDALAYLPKPDRERVRLGLGEVLGHQLDETPDGERPKMVTSVRLAVADFYRSQGDARAIARYEEMIGEFEAQEKRKPGSFAKWWIVPLAHLALFYSEQSQHPQSAQTWARWSAMPSDGEWQADWRVAAAREYNAAGQPEKARQLYAQVPQFQDGWQSSLALWDQANALMEQGQHEEARQVLQQPIVGEGADKARVGLQALLALSYYRTGEIEPARAAAQASVAAFEALRAGRDKGVPEQAQRARELLRRLDEWKRRPIQLEPQALNFSDEELSQLLDIGTRPETLVVRTFTVRTLAAEPLSVESDNPAIKAELFEDAPPEEFAATRALRVSVPLRALLQGLKADIIIRSENDAKRAVVLPLSSRQEPQGAE